MVRSLLSKIFSLNGVIVLTTFFLLCIIIPNFYNNHNFNVDTNIVVNELNNNYIDIDSPIFKQYNLDKTYEIIKKEDSVYGLAPCKNFMFEFKGENNNYKEVQIVYIFVKDDVMINAFSFLDLGVLTKYLTKDNSIFLDCIDLATKSDTDIKDKIIDNDDCTIKFNFYKNIGSVDFTITPK